MGEDGYLIKNTIQPLGGNERDFVPQSSYQKFKCIQKHENGKIRELDKLADLNLQFKKQKNAMISLTAPQILPESPIKVTTSLVKFAGSSRSFLTLDSVRPST